MTQSPPEDTAGDRSASDPLGRPSSDAPSFESSTPGSSTPGSSTPQPSAPAPWDGASPGQPGQASAGWSQPPPQGWGQQAPPADWSQQDHGQSPYAQGPPQQGYPPQQGHPPQQGYPPQQGWQGPPPQPYQAPMSASDEKLWSVLAHVGVPIVGFIGPLVIWLVFRDRSQFVRDNSVEALNWSILATASVLISSLLTALLIGLVLLPLVYVAVIVFAILGALAANRGETYRYPVNWRLVK